MSIFFGYRHSPVQKVAWLVPSNPYLTNSTKVIQPVYHFNCIRTIHSNPLVKYSYNTNHYNLDVLYAVNLLIISFCAASLLLAYFRNNDFWSPSHIISTESSSSYASISTRIGYLLIHLGVICDDGNTLRTQATAVSLSCAPPSQFLDWYIWLFIAMLCLYLY